NVGISRPIDCNRVRLFEGVPSSSEVSRVHQCRPGRVQLSYKCVATAFQRSLKWIHGRKVDRTCLTGNVYVTAGINGYSPSHIVPAASEVACIYQGGSRCIQLRDERVGP